MIPLYVCVHVFVISVLLQYSLPAFQDQGMKVMVDHYWKLSCSVFSRVSLDELIDAVVDCRNIQYTMKSVKHAVWLVEKLTWSNTRWEVISWVKKRPFLQKYGPYLVNSITLADSMFIYNTYGLDSLDSMIYCLII